MVKRRRGIELDQLKSMITLIYPYLALELSCDRRPHQLDDTLKVMIDMGLLRLEENEISPPAPEQPQHLQLTLLANLVSQTLEHVLQNAGDELTRENIMKQAASIDNLELGMLLPGIKVNTAADDYFPLEGMRLSRFDGETWEMFGDVIDVGGGS